MHNWICKYVIYRGWKIFCISANVNMHMSLVRSLVRPSRYLFKKLEVPFWSGIISKKSLFVQKRYLFDSKISQKVPFVSNRYLFFSQKDTLKRYLYTIFLRSFNLKKRLFNKSKISKKEKKKLILFSKKVPFFYLKRYLFDISGNMLLQKELFFDKFSIAKRDLILWIKKIPFWF